MIYTSSYFKPEAHHGQAIAISRGQPQGWRDIPKLEMFMPSQAMLDQWKNSAQDDAAWAEYCAAWWALMRPRKPKIVEWLESCDPAADLTLLCWEHDWERCHRKLVSAIIQKVKPELWSGESVYTLEGLIEWFLLLYNAKELPQKPFKLNAWSSVGDPPKFYSYLDSSIKRHKLQPDDPTEREHLLRDLTHLKTAVEHLPK